MSALFRAELANLARLVRAAEEEARIRAEAESAMKERSAARFKHIHEVGHVARAKIRECLASRNRRGLTTREIAETTGIDQVSLGHYITTMNAAGEINEAGRRGNARIWKLKEPRCAE